MFNLRLENNTHSKRKKKINIEDDAGENQRKHLMKKNSMIGMGTK